MSTLHIEAMSHGQSKFAMASVTPPHKRRGSLPGLGLMHGIYTPYKLHL